MNIFVRDGAVNRKRRFRHSITTRYVEPERKKIRGTSNDRATTAPLDLVASTPRLHSGESAVHQTTVVATEKDSRYLNADFMRARTFLYYHYKKISYINVNKSLKEHLKQFDENETQLKRIFEQCYNITGSVEKSKAMMKQLETNTSVRLDLTPNLSSAVGYRLPTLPRKVEKTVEKTVKKVHKMKDKKIKMSLKQKIDLKNLKLFGRFHSNKDKKIIYKNFDDINPVDDDGSCRLTAFYSVHKKRSDSYGITIISNPKTGLTVRGHPIAHENNLQSNTCCAEKSISLTNQLKGVFTSVHKKSKKGPSVHDTVNSQISASNMNSVREMINPQLNTDARVQNAKGFALKTVNSVREIVVPQLKMDESFKNAKSSSLQTNIDVEEISVSQLQMCGSVKNTKGFASKTIINVGEITVPQLKLSGSVNSAKGSALETIIDVGGITIPQFKIDGNIGAKGSAFETIIDVGRIAVPQLKIDRIVNSAKSSALETIVDVEKITDPQLKMDESVNSSKGSALETIIDVGEIMVPQLKINEININSKGSSLETIVDVREVTVPQLKMDESVKNAKSSSLQTNIDVEEISVSQLQMCGSGIRVKGSAMETNIDVGEIIDLGLENQTSIQDLVNSQVKKIDIDIDNSEKQSEILDYANIKFKIRKIINIDDDIFKSSIIQDLATYFLNNDFLFKIDILWKTTESELVGELIIKLLTMFNDRQYNMAQFSSCLICIFREIAQKSSIPPCEMKLKLIVFLDAIKKYIKFHDDGLWRNWFLPSMFFDWCFVVADIFMNPINDFKINFNKLSIIRNATAYYKKVKRCKYLFIDQDLKPNKSHKKSGIFELTRIDDLLEIDETHAINDTKVIPNIPIDIPSNETKSQSPVTDDNCMDTINHTTLENIEEVCPAPVHPQIFVSPEFSFSNSFINKSKWFTVDVSKLENYLNLSMSNKSIEDSTVHNNTTVVGNKTEPPFVNILQSITNKHVTKKQRLTNKQSVTNKPSKRKKSDTQVEAQRVFYTIANNPKEFEITYSSSAASQNSSSSTVLQNISSSAAVPQNVRPSTVPQHVSPPTVPQHLSPTVPQHLSPLITVPQHLSSSAVPQNVRPSTVPQHLSPSTVPQHLSSSAVPQHLSPSTVPQHFNPSTVPQHLSPYYNNISSNNAQLPVNLQAEVPRNLSLYYNNITSDYTRVPISLQTRPSISNARSMNPPVDINSPSSMTTPPTVSSNTWQSIYHQNLVPTNSQPLKAANTWPSNIYTSVCNVPSCSKKGTYHTEHTNSAMSYLQSTYNNNTPLAISHPQRSNALTYPTNYTQRISSNPLASIAAKVASMNHHNQQLQNSNNGVYSHNYRHFHSSQNNFQTLDHNTQVSPDLPDAQLPNMPNHQDTNIKKKTCMAANCTNTACYPCEVCMAASYCSTQCQKSDWHYHQNECR